MRLPLVLLIGAGGVGTPAALALARSGRCRLRVVDDDRVELTNLHRQILFGDSDVGRPKLDALAEALTREVPSVEIESISGRFLPETAATLLDGVAAILDGCDNFATRFLAADAAVLAGRPIAHGASVRWQATCVATRAGGRPCYRCLFEDIPDGPAPDCATAGVLGPVCGVAGGLAADAVLRLLAGDPTIAGTVASFDGRTGSFRRFAMRPRPGCPLCGEAPGIRDLDRARYVAPSCEA